MNARQENNGISCAKLWTCIWAITFAAYILLTFIYFCDHHIVYALDDAMIHLAVAKNLLHGTYGINPGEWSTPSSSLLYPFLLVPLLAVGAGTGAPLILNFLATGYTVWLVQEFLWTRIGSKPGNLLFGHLASPLLLMAVSAYALPLTGMEHSLHVCATIMVMRGLVIFAESGVVLPTLLLGCIALPFLRFEGLALSLVATAILLSGRKWREALLIVGALAAGFGAWGIFTSAIGLPFMPTSTLIKSPLVQSLERDAFRGLTGGILGNLRSSWSVAAGKMFYFSIPVLLISAVIGYRIIPPANAPRRRAQWILLIATAILPVAHLLAGRYGWFRYEVYAVAGIVYGALYLLSPLFAATNPKSRLILQAAVLAGLFYMTLPYAAWVLEGPYASRNMYEQQFQMQRFVAEYFPHRVAVNDIGWVSYTSPSYVMDLWGQASQAVARVRMSPGYDAAAVNRFTTNADIDFAMIYDNWFQKNRPQTWCRLAILDTEQVVAGGKAVSFYALKPELIEPMNAALDRFAPTLPARDSLERHRCD